MLKSFRDISIKHKITSIIVLTSAIVLLLSSAVYFISDVITFRHSLVDNLSTIAGLVGTNSAAALTFNDKKAAKNFLDALSTESCIISAAIYASDGTQLAKYVRPEAKEKEARFCLACHHPDKLLNDNQDLVLSGNVLSDVHMKQGSVFRKRDLILFRPIVFEDETIGMVYIQSDLEELRSRQIQNVGICALAMLLAVIVSYILSSKFQRVISEPVLKLAQTMETVSKENKYSVRVEKRGNDEIGILIDSFNGMSDNLQKTIDELGESEQRFQDLIKFANVGIVVAESSKITHVNIAAEKIYGYSKEELIGQTPGILTPDDYISKHKEMLNDLLELKEKKQMLFEEEGLRKDGSLFPIEISFAIPQKNTTIAVIRDITDRRQAEKSINEQHKALDKANENLKAEIYDKIQAEGQLRATKDHLEDLIRNSIDPIAICDSKTNIVNPNRAFFEMLGYPKEEIIGKDVFSFSVTEKGTYESTTGEPVILTEDYFRVHSEQIKKLFSEGKISNWPSYYLNKKNLVIPVIQSFVFLQNDKGKTTGSFGIIREITEQRKAELELIKTKEDMENVIETSLDPIVIADGKAHITRVNKAFLKMLSYSPEEVLGELTYSFAVFEAGTYELASGGQVTIDDKFLHEQAESAARLVKEGKISDWMSYYIDKNKKLIPIMQNIVIVGSDKGEQINTFGIIRDITQQQQSENQLIHYRDHLENMVQSRTDALAKANSQLNENLVELKQKEDELKQTMKKAEAANEAKSQFLATMSHEIRTPLNGIIGMAELAMDTELDDDQMDIFNTINEESNSLLSVINEILDFSKIEAAKIDLEEIPFDLRIMLEDVINSLFFRVSQRGLELLLFLPPELPTKMIGDPGKLRQILVNLIGNALKFTHKGEIYVKAEMTEDHGEHMMVRFSVKDTGIGIPKDKLETIFDSFTQVDGSTSRKYGGTGLGTTISKQFVEMMGGRIGVESNEGKGSTFWFTINFVKQPEQRVISVKKDIDAHVLQVLVVDDNRTNRYILMEYLRSWDCRPVEVPGGEEALSLLGGFVSSKEPFDLVLTDLMMPGMDGFVLAEKIRSQKDFEKLPIIVLTSAGKLGDGNRCKALEINGYLNKPIRRDILYKTIKSVMGIPLEPEESLPQELVTQHTIAEGNRKNVCILLAEDYPTNQQVALRHLQRAGYQTDLAENGRQAVEAFTQKHYDLILMDLQMPEMDGYEATKQIRNLEKPATHAPIIAMTAHAIKEYKERCIEAGMDDYITKPLRRKTLLETVEKWTGGIDDCRLKIENRENGKGDPEEPTAINHQSSTADNRSKDVAPMDFEKAVKEFEEDRDFLMEVIEGFLSNVKAQIGIIRQAITDGDAEVVRKESHAIKGGAANLCAGKLSGIAFDLEKIGKSGNLKTAAEALERLEKEFLSLAAFVEGI